MNNRLKLGIAKIGDLLLEDKITKTEDGDPLEKINLKIPEYQRPYKWTAKNANQLFDDIEEAMIANKEVYRVGTLILHRDETGVYNIVDGQQRIITFSLLLNCLDRKPFFLEQELIGKQYNLHNVKNNYRALERRTDKFSNEKDRNNLTEYICKHCELIVVITEDLSEAFQFFDSQNARGKSLYPHDLLKAYHLREMNNIDVTETERIVKMWEDLDQKNLAVLFNEYLYRLKEWVKGNRSKELTEHNIDLFKGITARDNYPYAKYYKGAFAYADELNRSHMPFVMGVQQLNPFQINAPIIAGKPFFEYAKHYFDILADIQNNSKYEGYFINDNSIVKTLNLRKYKNGVGKRITRLMFDTALLLYIDRFCPAKPSKADTEYLDQFLVFAFIWAYSMRAQYRNVGWQVAQNYIMGTVSKSSGIVNGFNIYKIIFESDSPSALLSKMADLTVPIYYSDLKENTADIDEVEEKVHQNYLYYFKKYKFLEKTEEK
ncbi:MAG: DUF262 domain-containing protein [Eubacterium sp.]|nr:DUF262 domain-containing protein [Eubacterium sp.]